MILIAQSNAAKFIFKVNGIAPKKLIESIDNTIHFDVIALPQTNLQNQNKLIDIATIIEPKCFELFPSPPPSITKQTPK